MIDRDVIVSKVDHLQNCLKRIHTITSGKPSAIKDLTIQEVVILNLQALFKYA